MLKKNPLVSALLAALLLFSLAFVGCDSKSVADNDSTGTGGDPSLTVTASPNSVETGNQSVIVVSIANAGEGEIVSFAVEPSGAGTLSRSIDTTDANGEAATVFTANTTGAVTVRASVSVGGTVLENTVGLTVSSVATVGSGNVNINISPSLLLATGADTSLVTVLCTDADGNPAPAGTMVYLTAGEKFDDIDGNGYYTQGVDSVVYDAIDNDKWDAMGSIPSTATLDADGLAVVSYITGTTSGTVYIRATVTSGAYAGYGEAALTLTPDVTVNSIALYSEDLHLAVKRTGGLETSRLIAVGYDAHGNRVPEGLPISFIITDGPSDPTDADGEHLSNLIYPDQRGPYVTVTNSEGEAYCPISSGTVSGTIKIRASADTVISSSTQIMVHAGPPAELVVAVEECNVAGWNTINTPNGVSAIVSDIYNNPVGDSVVVYFTCDEGVVYAHDGRTTDENGSVTSTWVSNGPELTGDGQVIITAETSGGTVSSQVAFINSGAPVTMIPSGAPASILADGESNESFIIYVYDVNGNYVTNGTSVESDAKFVSVSSGTVEDGCNDSYSRHKVVSATLKQDFSLTGAQDDGIGAVDYMKFWIGVTAAVNVPVNLTTGVAYTENCEFNGPETVSLNSQVRYNVIIQDRYGNPLGDHTLNMSASGGAVSGATQESNTFGEASGFTWTAPGVAGNYTLTIYDTDPRGGIYLTKTITVE